MLSIMKKMRRQLGLGIGVDHHQLWAEFPDTRIMHVCLTMSYFLCPHAFGIKIQ